VLTDVSITRLLHRFWPRVNRGAAPNSVELLAELQYLKITRLRQLLAVLKKQRRS
jgi:hypothetical protein